MATFAEAEAAVRAVADALANCRAAALPQGDVERVGNPRVQLNASVDPFEAHGCGWQAGPR